MNVTSDSRSCSASGGCLEDEYAGIRPFDCNMSAKGDTAGRKSMLQRQKGDKCSTGHLKGGSPPMPSPLRRSKPLRKRSLRKGHCGMQIWTALQALTDACFPDRPSLSECIKELKIIVQVRLITSFESLSGFSMLLSASCAVGAGEHLAQLRSCLSSLGM